jgi:integrase
MALNDTFIKNGTKWSGKPAGDKHNDGGGLYLHIKQAGKYWRMNYRLSGKQRTLAIGVYPAVSLAKARKERTGAREQLAQGIDPSTAKQEAKHAEKVASVNTYEAVAREFHGIKAHVWSESYAAKWLRLNEMYLLPVIGRLPLDTIKPPALLKALRKVEDKGILSTAEDLQQMAGQVFRYGVQTGRCERDIAADLRGALKPHVTRHFSAILDPVKVGELLRAIDAYTGQPTTVAALKLSPMFFQRPGNIRKMEWAWIDLERAMLTIPPADMKRTKAQKINGKAHLIPLARQAVEILRAIQPLTGYGRYVFAGARSSTRPMSNNTINAALRRMDFSGEEQVAHGFRAMARTMLAERLHGIPDALVEAQLGHGKSGPLGAAYDRAEYLEQRRLMMQTWADYLDRLRTGADVIPLHRAA